MFVWYGVRVGMVCVRVCWYGERVMVWYWYGVVCVRVCAGMVGESVPVNGVRVVWYV